MHDYDCPSTGCDHVAPSMDHLVDHVSDVHGWTPAVALGRDGD